MQATGAAPHRRPTVKKSNKARNLSWFLLAPVTGVVLLVILVALLVTSYEYRHSDSIYTGVMAWGVDLSGLSKEDAQKELATAFPYMEQDAITVVDPVSDQRWTYSPEELGMSFDAETTVEAAFEVGRQGNPFNRLKQQFAAWYYGTQVAPVVVFNEGDLDQAVIELAGEINQPAADANLGFDGSNVSFTTSQLGKNLDLVDTRVRMMAALDSLQAAEIQLLVHETQPRIDDTSVAAQEIQQIMSGPMTLFLQEPLAGVDLERVIIPVEDLAAWIRVITVEDEQGKATTQVILDENALRAWLRPYAELLQRDPTNARYYFDDNSQELVLVEAHGSGRALDIDATAEQFLEQVRTPNRSMPFILKEIVPTVHAEATGEELGITELVSESTTWFYGSSGERMHNIARAASNFYGIVIAPGEEFSFNKFLGEVTAEQGYEQGLIIFGGRTIEGVGGGVCQVSTTAFQAAFWAGFPITERWQHGYQVGYYDDGEGPGMDATVYSPLVDLSFINDTPYHLLIENYYSEANSSLTFKFYSTGLGREIIKDDPIIANVVPPKPDVWEFNPELPEGEIEQVDWAVEGADVSIGRSVFNASGELIRQDNFVSNYIPWQNIYQYGSGVELPTPEAPTPAAEVDES